MNIPVDNNFQTLPIVADYMANMLFPVTLRLGRRGITVLEPTPGQGKLIWAANSAGYVVYGPGSGNDYWEWSEIPSNKDRRYDGVLMNPPFTPVKEMERFVNNALEKSDNVIALLPWSYIINSERRLGELMLYGLKSVTNLPRKTFAGSRVQTAIFELHRGYMGKTELKKFSW